MKTLLRSLAFITLMFFFFNNSDAQKANYTVGGLTLGLGTGATYQVSDIANSQGLGFDFTLGTPIYKKQGAFFGLDWKFRFLAGNNKAYDHRINTADGTFSNVHYNFYNYDLELGLSLNRLRERTGIVLSGFAGAGATQGQTFTDLLDAGNGNAAYDFSGIDPNQEKSLVYDDLVALSDGDFETSEVKKVALLPTAGFFIGYQFSRSFTLGIEYKTNFYLAEQNGLLGLDLDNNAVARSAMDRNNYVSLGLKWNLRGGRSYDNATTVTENYQNNIVSAALPPPTVKFTDPSNETSVTQSPNQTIKARVENVSSADNIKFFQNGYANYNFSYSQSTKVFTVRVRLRDGENNFKIEAKNQGASSEDIASMTLTVPQEVVKTIPVTDVVPPVQEVIQPVVQMPLPTVRITNPSVSTTVQDNRFSLRAETRNVSKRNDVNLKLNGVELGTYSFTSYSGVSAGLVLKEGINTVEITVYNDAGHATDRTSITYSKPVPRIAPTTRRTNTSYNPPKASTKTVIINEEVVQEDPRVRKEPVVTEEPVTNQGRNLRDASKLNRPTRTKPVSPVVTPGKKPCNPPTLSMRVNEVSRLDATHVLKGSIANGDSRTDIMLTIDGRSNENYSFNPKTGSLNAKFRLTAGTHRINVEVINACGSVSKSASITYVEDIEERETVPPVVEEPVVEEPVVEEPVVEEPVVEEPVVEEPVAEEPVVEEPEVEEPVVEEPVVEEPVVEEPVVEEPVVEEPIEEVVNCGVRINPGNSAWEFCLETPSGTFTRDNLQSTSFSYTGPASSLYFKPIGGGGDALVNGSPYSLRSGQYYLFTGSLTVTVSTSNPGSMGHWSVCISASKAPVTGNGNNRPASPCAEDKKDKKNKGN